MREDYLLIFDDEYVNAVQEYCNAVASCAQFKLSILTETLAHVCQEGIVEGKTAEALRNFTDAIAPLAALVEQYGQDCAALAQEFFQEIDEIDDHLYDS